MFYVKEIKMSYFYYRLLDTCKKTKVYKLTFPRLIFKILPLGKNGSYDIKQFSLHATLQ